VNSVGLYLAGAGSLDGSDPFLTTFAYQALQSLNYDPVPLARDIKQGEVINHRFAHRESNPRNSLDESARLVRGKIDDLRDVDTERLAGAVLVGGGGVLNTWTDFHERAENCRITERLKFHLHELNNQEKPIFCLGNAGFAVAVAFREQEVSLLLNPGKNPGLRKAINGYGSNTTDSNPSWDQQHQVGCLTDLLGNEELPTIHRWIHDFFREHLFD